MTEACRQLTTCDPLAPTNEIFDTLDCFPGSRLKRFHAFVWGRYFNEWLTPVWWLFLHSKPSLFLHSIWVWGLPSVIFRHIHYVADEYYLQFSWWKCEIRESHIIFCVLKSLTIFNILRIFLQMGHIMTNGFLKLSILIQGLAWEGGEEEG